MVCLFRTYCTSISSAKAAQLINGMKTFSSTSTLILVVISSQLSTCAYRGWYLTKLMVGLMVVLVMWVLVVVSLQL